jgi:transposase
LGGSGKRGLKIFLALQTEREHNVFVPHLESLSREELIALILEQRRLMEQLRKEIEELRRGGHRQAAPFSKGKPAKNPKPPGRKPGEGIFRRRSAPSGPPSEVVTAVVPPCCPHCGGGLEQEGEEVVTTTELPKPQPVVIAYHVPICRCRGCGKSVRGRAAGLAADQTGATAHRVGPGVMAAAHALHYGMGIPVRKVPQVLEELTGVRVTQSAVTQDALRRAAGLARSTYEQLRLGVGRSPAVYTDDTGWRVGGQNAFLMAFDTDEATVYQIRRQHRNEEVREVIPASYAGVMISDRGKSYDAEELAGLAQQKCLSHLLRNVSEVVKGKQGRARQFGATLSGLLREGLALWRARTELEATDFRTRSRQLDEQLTHHLRVRILRDDDNQRLLDGIGLQQDRGNLLRFLDCGGVEPTNNRAERILRPAVIARKVSQCSKNQQGADAFAVFMSIAQTARKAVDTTVSRAFRQLFSIPVTSTAR